MDVIKTAEKNFKNIVESKFIFNLRIRENK